jgi:hypothetical protein
MIGNQAVLLGWSHASDVTLLYPGFPCEHFDHGFRFLTQRSLATTAFGSLAWARVQSLQDRLVGKPSGTLNQFGLVDDMEALARALTNDVNDRIERYPERIALHPALLELVRLAHERRVPVLLVEVPMPSAYRAALGRATRAPRLREALTDLVVSRGGSSVNLGHPPWIDDTLFDDGLHLGRAGAELFTKDLSARVAGVLGSRPDEPKRR